MAARQNVIEFLIRARDQASGVVGRVRQTIGDFRVTAVAAATAIAGAFAGVFGASFIKDQIEAAAAMKRLSDNTGVAVEDLDALRQQAAKQRIEWDAVTDSLEELTENIAEAAGGSGEAADGFASMGISVTDAEGKLKRTDQILLELADRFALIEDPVAKGSAAMGIMGDAGFALLPLLNQGRAAIEGFTRAARENGEVLTNEQAASAKQASEALQAIDKAIDSVIRGVAVEFAPTITRIANIIREQAIPYFGQFRDTMVEALQKAGGELAGFLASFDFKSAIDKVAEFAADFVGAMTKVGQVGTAAANTVAAAWNAAMVPFHGAVAAGRLLVGSFIETLANAADIAARFGLVSKETAAELHARAREFQEASFEAANAAGASFDKLKDNVVGVYDAFTDSSGAAKTLTADTQDLGKASGQAALELGKLDRSLEETERHLQDTADKAKLAAIALDAAFTRAGLQTVASLERAAEKAKLLLDDTAANSTATAEDIATAFRAYAEAARAAIAGASEEEQAALERRLELSAETLGIEERVADVIETRAERQQAELEAIQQLLAANQEAAAAERDRADAGAAAAAAAERAGEATRQAADDIAAGTERAAESSDSYANSVTRMVQHLYTLSQAAGDTFLGIRRDTGAASDAAAEFERRWQGIRDVMLFNREIVGSLGGPMDDLNARTLQISENFYQQALAAEQLRVNLVAAMEAGTLSAGQLERAAAAARHDFELLDQTQLSGLNQAIDEATGRLRSLQEEARRTVDALRDELAQLEGRQDDIEARRFARRRQELEQLREAAKLSGDQAARQDAEESLRLLREAHAIRLRNLREEGAERRRQEAQSRQAQPSQAQGPVAPLSPTAAPTAGGFGRTAKVQFLGRQGELIEGLFEDRQVEQLLELLRRHGARALGGL